MKKLISLIAVLALVVAALITAPSAYATTFTLANVTPADLVAGAVGADYNVSFSTGITATATSIVVTFPVGYTITAGALGATAVQSIAPATPTAGNIAVGSTNVVVSTVTGDAAARTITIAIGATNLSPGVGFRILIGVTNPTTSGATGTFGLTTNATGEVARTAPAININPAAIADLICEPSGQAGAVWLRWTTPVGASHGYTVRHREGTTIGDFAAATTFVQTWPSGVVGSVQQQLLIGLNPNTQYTFAMTAGGGNATWSAVSSLTPICFAPAAARRPLDTIPPVSRVTLPAVNANILTGQPLIIRGTALDTGGSSVQRIEVSVDNGTTWNLARAVDNIEGNLIWEFIWANPTVGTQTIQTRALDWVGNIERPGAGIVINVTTALPAVPAVPAVPGVPIAPITPALPALPHPTPATVVQMQENLAILQTHLLSLLQQLIAALTTQLQLPR